jgi:hypothetical protein
MGNNKLPLLIGFVAMLFLLTACGTSIGQIFSKPVAVTRTFMRALNNDNASRALDQICESMVVPTMPKHFLRDLEYTELTNDDTSASVEVRSG